MYDYLLDFPDQDTVQPRHLNGVETPPPDDDLYMSRYQKERQRVYDRAHHMVHDGGYAHADVEDAKAEAGLVRGQAKVSRARGSQIGWVRHMLRRGATARFGYPNPTGMVASRLDIRRSAARELVYLAERLGDHQIEGLRSGAVSYERVLAETRLTEAGASADEIETSRNLDLEEVKRMLQAQRKITRADEREAFEGQYISIQPSLYGDHAEVKGRLSVLEADICRQGLDRRGERIVPSGEAHPDPGQRRALALTTLCQDELDRTPQPTKTTSDRIRQARHTPEPAETTAEGVREAPSAPDPAETTTDPIREAPSTPEPAKTTTAERYREARRRRREPALMIIANQTLAQESGNEQGVAILAGARVGPDTVDLVQCVGTTEVITVAGQNILGHATTTSMRPSLRRAVLARDDGCTIDGCTSTYRLQAHHITPRSQGGTHTAENLTTLCWYHHHVAIHRRGMRIDPQSPPRRRRLLPPRARTCGYHSPEPDPHTLAILRAIHTPTNRAPP